MEGTKLQKKNCTTKEYENIYPITYLSNVLDKNGKSLDTILNNVNHIFLTFVNTKAETRKQIPVELRRQGLWITYIICSNCNKHTKKVITEWYSGSDVTDEEWSNNKNWKKYLEKEVIGEIFDDLMEWYKAPEKVTKSITHINNYFKSRFHYYKTMDSFNNHMEEGHIGQDSICFIEETRQIFAQGELYCINIKEWEQLVELVNTHQDILDNILGIKGDTVDDGIINNLKDITNFLKGFTDDSKLKDVLHSIVVKLKHQIFFVKDILTEKFNTLEKDTRETLEGVDAVVAQVKEDSDRNTEILNTLSQQIEETLVEVNNQVEIVSSLNSRVEALEEYTQTEFPALQENINTLTSSLNEVINNLNTQIESLGQPNGIATLNEEGKVKEEQLPALKTINGKSIIGEGNIELDLNLYSVVTELPTEDINLNKVYLVPTDDAEENNIYTEYAYINDAWEILGTYKSKIDLSEYYTKEEIDTINKEYYTSVEVNEKFQPKGDYLTKHQDISNLATKEELEAVSDKIDNIDIPEVDLTPYATKDELNEVIESIPSTEGLASEEYVDEKFNNIEIPEVETLSNTEIDSLCERKSINFENQEVPIKVDCYADPYALIANIYQIELLNKEAIGLSEYLEVYAIAEDKDKWTVYTSTNKDETDISKCVSLNIRENFGCDSMIFSLRNKVLTDPILFNSGRLTETYAILNGQLYLE